MSALPPPSALATNGAEGSDRDRRRRGHVETTVAAVETWAVFERLADSEARSVTAEIRSRQADITRASDIAVDLHDSANQRLTALDRRIEELTTQLANGETAVAAARRRVIQQLGQAESTVADNAGALAAADRRCAETRRQLEVATTELRFTAAAEQPAAGRDSATMASRVRRERSAASEARLDRLREAHQLATVEVARADAHRNELADSTATATTHIRSATAALEVLADCSRQLDTASGLLVSAHETRRSAGTEHDRADGLVTSINHRSSELLEQVARLDSEAAALLGALQRLRISLTDNGQRLVSPDVSEPEAGQQ
jgi:hypothetical protein